MSDYYSVTDNYLFYESAKSKSHYDAFGGPENAGPPPPPDAEEDSVGAFELVLAW